MKTIAELNAIKEKRRAMSNMGTHILVCGGTGCTSNKSMNIIKALNEEIEKNGLQKDVSVVMTGCFGLCAKGPIMVIYPEGTFYHSVTVDDVKEIVQSHIIGNPLKGYCT